jgi:alpha-maltose-1-phosphate synthase
MKVIMLTREYPPRVYGGAGVHVEYLSRELARLVDVEVRRFGSEPPQPGGPGTPAVRSVPTWDAVVDEEASSTAVGVLSTDLAMTADMEGPSVVHSHTWYTNVAGHLAKLKYGVPHVATSHSLEPLRPWKAEQLGAGGYAISRFCERTGLLGADAIIAVSTAMRADLLRTYPEIEADRVCVIHNGIDAREFRRIPDPAVVRALGVDLARPRVVFVGRITRQKGIPYLLRAAARLRHGVQLVLVAGSPDEPEIAEEVATLVESVRGTGRDVIWIDRTLTRPDLIEVLSHATVFVCPSLYEPLGIVNLEAMACGAPVVATRTGGIPEVVEDGATGWLVPFEPADELSTPADPRGFEEALADRVNDLIDHPDRAEAFGRAGRARVEALFSWEAVAARTVEVYERVVQA